MGDKPEGNRTCLYTSAQLEIVLDAMAMQAAGLLAGKDKALLVGILRRGAPLSDMLYARLVAMGRGGQLRQLHLKVKRYSDDLQLLHPETLLTEAPEHSSLDLTGTTVLVIDDVMWGGHSMLRAVEYLANKNAEEIRTAVLVDRGVTLLPIRSDIAGLRLDIAPTDIIECNVPPYEEDFRIDLLQPASRM